MTKRKETRAEADERIVARFGWCTDGDMYAYARRCNVWPDDITQATVHRAAARILNRLTRARKGAK